MTGNRCERGAGGKKEKNTLPNLMQFKYERFFAYEGLPEVAAVRGTVGLPRTMNMFENYPFWHTFFTSLRYRTVLSPKSSKKLYESGMDTIPSESHLLSGENGSRACAAADRPRRGLHLLPGGGV